MAPRLHVSLKHAYELYVEQEIENYKFSLPRPAILRIGDEAVSALRDRTQPEFDELVLCSEVDRIISQRLRIPTYSTWRKRRLKLLAQYRKPEHWGLTADAPLVCEIAAGRATRASSLPECSARPSALPRRPWLPGHGARGQRRGRRAGSDRGEPGRADVTREGRADRTGRVGTRCAAQRRGGDARPRSRDCTQEQRTRVIDLLKHSTLDGGVHLVDALVAGESGVTMEELRARYRGWDVSVVRDGAENRTFLARKSVA